MNLHAHTLCVLGAASVLTCSSGQAQQKPNVVFIITDDVGYGDLSCYGAKLMQTPRLDQLAREGCRFTDAHSAAATCSPSRRALLTGVYSWRQKEGSAILPGDAPLSIEPGSFTLPTMFKKAGYRTAAVGKWHLGLGTEKDGINWNGEIRPGPQEIGFDEAFIIPATGDRVPCVYIENRRIVGLSPDDPITVNYKKKVGTEPTGRENPELLKLKATHGHDNTIVNGIGRIGWMTGGKSARWKDEEMADTLTSRAVSFIEQKDDSPFFLYFATHNIHVPRVPNARFVGKTPCGRRGDAILELDASIGEVMNALERSGVKENTLVIFTSDNGGTVGDGYEDVAECDHPCNGVLRGFKSTVYEGGHRVPFIARWPGHIKPGSECGELITQIDMLASFASLTGVTIPEGAARDSVNVLPALIGTPHEKPARTEFIAHRGGMENPFGVRKDEWKLNVLGGGPRQRRGDANTTANLQLFNLREDLSERNDLAQRNPEKVAELLALLERERNRD